MARFIDSETGELLPYNESDYGSNFPDAATEEKYIKDKYIDSWYDVVFYTLLVLVTFILEHYILRDIFSPAIHLTSQVKLR